MRRHDHHFEAIDLLKLEGLGVRRAGHARQLLVEAEIVLEGDRGDGLVLFPDPHALLGLDCLVKAVRPAPAGHRAAGKLVNDHYFAIAHDVLDVPAEQGVGAQRCGQVVHQADIGGVVEALALGQQALPHHQLFDLLVSVLRQENLPGLLIHREVARPALVVVRGYFLLAGEVGHEAVDPQVELGTVVSRTGNDQRGAGLVDEDGVDLIHHRENQTTLHLVLAPEGQVVPEVVEAKFVVGAIGDIRGIGRPLLGAGLAVADDANLEPQEAEYRTHPFGVPLGQILVHGDDMHALPGERVEVGRQRGHQGLALAGAHLGDLALMQGHSAQQLDIEMTQAKGAAGGLADGGKGLRDQVVQRRAIGQPLAEFRRPGPQGLVIQGPGGGLQLVGGGHDPVVAPQHPLIAAAKKPREPLQQALSPPQPVGRGSLF